MAPPKRTRAQAVKSDGPSVPIQASTRLRVNENSDVDAESSENESDEEIESDEENEVEGQGQAEKIVQSGEQIESEEMSEEIEEVEVEGIEAEEVEVDEIGSAGAHDGSGPVGPVGPAISILPPTPAKNKGKGKGTPDDYQEEMLQNSPDFDPDSLQVENDEPGRSKRGRERSGTGDVRGSKTYRRSASHSTAPTVPSTEEDDDMDDLDEIEPQGSSRSTGGFSRGRAAGNYYNHADADDMYPADADDMYLADANDMYPADADDMDLADWNASRYGKVLVYVNRETETAPYMSFTTKAAELPVVLKELSGRFSPIEKRNCRIYVFEEKTWEVKGRFSQAVMDDSPLPWARNDDGQLVLCLLAVGIFFF